LVAIGGTMLLSIWTLVMQMGVMHDASHSSVTEGGWGNRILAGTLTFIGACSILWHYKHVVKHHGKTNIPGRDPDIDSGGMFRFHDGDKWRFFHRFQHWYAVPAYSLLGVRWMWLDDLKDIVMNVHKVKTRTRLLMIGEWILSRSSHFFFFFYLPAMFVGSYLAIVPFYFLHWMMVGTLMALTFQLAHVVKEAQFLADGDDRTKDWALHQLATTADFAVKNRLLTWAVGGLNYQVEHHIFPRMSHRWYHLIQPVVKEYCAEKGVPYYEAPSIATAIRSHFKHLKRLAQKPAEPTQTPLATAA
jgi:linoleoyl-CoA desaturase